MKSLMKIGLWFLSITLSTFIAGAQVPATNLWELAKTEAATHRFSTLFTAQDVRDRLSSEAGLASAMDWCKRTAVTKVYIESFRDGYQADLKMLQTVRDQFKDAGFLVSGCVTPTGVGKKSSGWDAVSCYTDPGTQAKIKAIFEFTAGLFDEIMIDDFWFTDCECADCKAARAAKTVTVGGNTFPVTGEGWEDYRCELMVQVSRANVLAASKKVNPKATLIIKYPQWYDNFHVRGYDVVRQTADFDKTWVGTETRDYGDARWGGTPQYEAYFIMRWLGQMGGDKCGGGWYDWLGTTERTYLEQARMTILGGAKESMLFCYGGLQGTTGPKNIELLRKEIPKLFQMARDVAKRTPIGVAAYKPPGSDPENEKRVYDFVGMMGIPLVPCHVFPKDAPAAFFPVHCMKDPDFPKQLAAFIYAGKPVLITDGLKKKLAGKVDLTPATVQILEINGEPKKILDWPQDKVDAIRAPLLRPLRTTLKGPNKVAFFMFNDGSWFFENFNEDITTMELNRLKHMIGPRNWFFLWKNNR